MKVDFKRNVQELVAQVVTSDDVVAHDGDTYRRHIERDLVLALARRIVQEPKSHTRETFRDTMYPGEVTRLHMYVLGGADALYLDMVRAQVLKVALDVLREELGPWAALSLEPKITRAFQRFNPEDTAAREEVTPWQ